MKEILSSIFLFLLAAIFSLIESLYNLLKNDKFWIGLFLLFIVVALGTSLERIVKSLRDIFEQLRNKEDGDGRETMVSIISEIRDVLNKDGHSEELLDKIKTYEIMEEQRITKEEFLMVKMQIFDLLESPEKYHDRPALPIEISSAKRAFRFILLMDEYNYLTKNNLPGIDGNPDGGVSLSFGYGNSWFTIDIPPEENQSMHYYQYWIDDSADPVAYDRVNEGYSNNPLEVLHNLIESGELMDS